MDKKILKILIIVISIVFIINLLIILIKDNNKFVDTVKYQNKTYVLLEYNMDIFTYNYNSNNYYEEDIIHPISHNKWDVVYFNGDLFILDKHVKMAKKYYANDKNYDWYVIFDEEEKEVKKSISISSDELLYLYNIEKVERDNTIIFDDIDKFASILKVSKDGLVQAIITLVQIDGSWYYKTEIMTDDDREYVVKICDSLNNKINDLIDK